LSPFSTRSVLSGTTVVICNTAVILLSDLVFSQKISISLSEFLTASLFRSPLHTIYRSTLRNLYLHYVFDLWLERVVKPRLRGEAYLVRCIDDFVLCFQFCEDVFAFRMCCAREWEVWLDPGTG